MDNLNLDQLNIKLEIGHSMLNILYMRFAPSNRIKTISNHVHSSYELHFIPSGEGTLITKDMCYSIKPGDFYLTGPGVYHAQKGHEDNPMTEYCINFEIINNTNHHDSSTEDHNIISNTLKNTTFWYGRDQFNSMALFEKITAEDHDRYIGYMDNIKHYIHLIIMNCIRSYLPNPHSLDQPPMKSTDDHRRFITDSFLQNYKKHVTIEELSDLLQLSHRQTRRVILSIYGMSLHEKVTEMRMDDAKYTLSHSKKTIKDIASNIGYEDALYFSKLFKKEVGMSPTLYRQNNMAPSIISP